jgi:hypothetical protein
MKPAQRLAALLLVVIPGLLAAQPPEKQAPAYLAQLKRKAAEWDKIVGQVQGTIESKSETESKTGKVKHDWSEIYKQNSSSVLMIEHQQRGDDRPNTKMALGYNATYAFELNEMNGNWRPSDRNLGLPKETMHGLLPLRKSVATRLSINYPIHFFDQEKTRLEKTEVVRKGKQNLFSVRFTNAVLDENKNLVFTIPGVAYFDIDRDLSIVYQETESVINENGLRKTLSKVTTEYEGKLGEFPRPKRRMVELKQDGGTESESTTRRITTYNLRLDAKVPDREFTLSAFGLPEPKKDE